MTLRHPQARAAAPFWLLVLCTFSSTVAMYIFVPALPAATKELGADLAIMHLTVSGYVMGLAVGQLVYGPLADWFGRRPVLLAGLSLFTAAGLAAALARDPVTLVAARIVQALGGCVGLVLGRAMVRDTAQGSDAIRRMAIMTMMMTVGPGMAPMLGSALTEWFGWRVVLALMAVLGAVNIVCAWFLLPETLAARSEPGVSAVGVPARMVSLARDYFTLLRSPAFIGFSLGGGCATTAWYAFLSSAPFIFADHLGRPAAEAGYYLAGIMAFLSLGNAVASRISAGRRVSRLVLGANLMSALATCVLLTVVLGDRMSIAAVVGPMMLFMFAAGIVGPMALTRAIGVNPQVIGSAAGLYGFTQMMVGALCVSLAGMGQDVAVSAAVVLAGAAFLAQASFRTAFHFDRRD